MVFILSIFNKYYKVYETRSRMHYFASEKPSFIYLIYKMCQVFFGHPVCFVTVLQNCKYFAGYMPPSNKRLFFFSRTIRLLSKDVLILKTVVCKEDQIWAKFVFEGFAEKPDVIGVKSFFQYEYLCAVIQVLKWLVEVVIQQPDETLGVVEKHLVFFQF